MKSLIFLATLSLASPLMADTTAKPGPVPIAQADLGTIFVSMKDQPVAVPLPLQTGPDYFSVLLPGNEMRFYVHLPRAEWDDRRTLLPHTIWIATHRGDLHWKDDASRLMGLSVGLDLMALRGNRALAKLTDSRKKHLLESKISAITFASRVVKKSLFERAKTISTPH